ncbi:MAG: AI-2E family transporter [Chloroflexi bacterium]|nr:AI-2E family transporter [Chloroflexota bacterium]
MQGLLQAESGQRNRRILVIVALCGVGLFLFLARGALTPFILGLALAYVALPLVRRIEGALPFSTERRGQARLLALLSVYLAMLALLVLAGVLVLPMLVQQVLHFFELLPATVARAQEVLDSLAAEYQASVPPELRGGIEDALARSAQNLGSAVQEGLVKGLAVVSQTFSLLLGLLTIPVWLFYVLKDREQARAWFYRLVPAGAQEDVAAVAGIVDRVLSSYLRAQLFLGLAVGLLTGIGLALLGVPSALVLGLISGVTELIPILGPILGSVIGILVTLANAPEKVLLVLILYVGVQQLENNLLVPRIQGQAVAMHPAVIMVLLVLTSEVAGLWGMLVAVPIAAVCRDVFTYLYRRFGAERES